jgi:hypothetical protein
MRNRPGTLGLLLLALALVPGKAAELDEIQSYLVRGYELPLRWENVEHAPEWVGGVKPTYCLTLHMHVVELKPGETTTIRVPPDSMVRLHNQERTLSSGDVDVALSNGSGLYADWPTVPSTDGHSIFVVPESPISLLARVSRPCAAGSPLTVALFVSRREPLGEIAPYRCVVRFDAPSARVRRCDEAAPQEYWPVRPGLPLHVELNGPGRFAVETRLFYPAAEARAVQFFQVRVGLGSQPYQVLEYETSLEARFDVYVNLHTEFLSRREVAYLEIPPGKHSVQFDPTAPLYLRVLRLQEPDYCLPKLNGPWTSPATLQAAGITQVLRLNPWDVTPHQAEDFAAAEPVRIAEKERVGLRLVRDNRYREGGLAGTMLLRLNAPDRLDYPRVREVAEKFDGFHTFYRDLWPEAKPTPEPQGFGWFIVQRLLNPGEVLRGAVLPPQLLDDFLDRLGRAFFVAVPTGAEAALVYPLPERFGPTDLRVMVESGTPVRGFWVQIGAQPPRRLLICSTPELPPHEYMPAEVEAALAMVPGLAGGPTEPTLGGPFSHSRLPGPLLPVAEMELPVPPTAERIRVWADAGAGPVQVALQYRASRPYRLSEMEYLDLAGRVSETESHAIFQGLLHNQVTAGNDPVSARELVNDWVPLLRLLRSDRKQFESAVVRDPEDRPADRPAPAARQAELSRRAREREQAGQWTAALEAWSELIHVGSAENRRAALLGRVTALEELGEQFLAERQLRALFLFEDDAETHAEARSRLTAIYARYPDVDALQMLDATEVLLHPSAEALAALADVLVTNGEFDLALTVGLGIEKGRQPVVALLRAAYQRRWWRVYELFVGGMAGPEVQAFWRAHRALAEGQVGPARDLLAKAGALGRPVLDSLEKALAIQAGLGSPDPAARLRAAVDWTRWQAEQPGPLTWQDEPSAVIDYAGAESVYSVDRDLYARFSRATPERPVKIRVVGPVRLRLETRPIHPQDSTRPLEDDWLRIREPGALTWYPITDNFASQGLVIVGDPAHVPGVRVQPEIEVGPGLHELEVSALTHALLVRVYVQRPEMPLGVLPTLTPDTLLAGLQAGSLAHPTLPPDEIPGWLQRFQEESERRNPSSLERREAALVAQGQLDAALALPAEDDAALLRKMVLLLRLAETQADRRSAVQVRGEALFAAHPRVPLLQEVYTRLTRRSVWEPILTVEGGVGFRQIQLQGYLPESPLLRTRVTLVTPLALPDQAVSGYDRFLLAMNVPRPVALTLEFWAEDMAHLPPAPLTAFYQLDDRPPVRLEFPVEVRRQVRQMIVPRGLHSMRFWLADPLANQLLRFRVEELRTDLFAANRAGAILGATALPGVPQAVTVPVALAFGYHEASPDRYVIRLEKRLYHIATPDRPIRVRIQGPAWLRIDELRPDGSTFSRYLAVEPGWQTVPVQPGKGQKEALVRAFQRTPAPEEPVVLPRFVRIETTPVPPPLVRLDQQMAAVMARTTPEPVAPTSDTPLFGTMLVLDDEYILGRQENGTLAVGSGYWRRLPLDEVQAQTSQLLRAQVPNRAQRSALLQALGEERADKYAELDVSHFYYDEWDRLWYETDLLTRLREESGPTLALRERIRWDPPYCPIVIQADGEGYTQRPGGEILPDLGKWESSGLFWLSIGQHREVTPRLSHDPTWRVFGRLLSEVDVHYLPGKEDEDVFTPYKAQHRDGQEFADTVVYRPWLDTEWWGRASAMSNEDFGSFDHVLGRVGWRKWLGDVELDADYRAIQFFGGDSRPHDETRQIVHAGLLCDCWPFHRSRLETAVDWEYDLTKERYSLFVSFVWYFDHNRRYRDLRPDALRFLDLRQRRADEMLYNNHVGLTN